VPPLCCPRLGQSFCVFPRRVCCVVGGAAASCYCWALGRPAQSRPLVLPVKSGACSQDNAWQHCAVAPLGTAWRAPCKLQAVRRARLWRAQQTHCHALVFPCCVHCVSVLALLSRCKTAHSLLLRTQHPLHDAHPWCLPQNCLACCCLSLVCVCVCVFGGGGSLGNEFVSYTPRPAPVGAAFVRALCVAGQVAACRDVLAGACKRRCSVCMPRVANTRRRYVRECACLRNTWVASLMEWSGGHLGCSLCAMVCCACAPWLARPTLLCPVRAVDRVVSAAATTKHAGCARAFAVACTMAWSFSWPVSHSGAQRVPWVRTP
jgi:hypothetical protein